MCRRCRDVLRDQRHGGEPDIGSRRLEIARMPRQRAAVAHCPRPLDLAMDFEHALKSGDEVIGDVLAAHFQFERIEMVVVDQPFGPDARSGPGIRLQRRDVSGGLARLQRQQEPERASLARRAVDADMPAHHPYKPVADRQSEAGPRRLA